MHLHCGLFSRFLCRQEVERHGAITVILLNVKKLLIMAKERTSKML